MSEIANLLHQLIKTNLRLPQNASYEQNQKYNSHISTIYNYLLKILNSNISCSPTNLNFLGQKIHEDLSYDSNSQVHFGLVFNKFKTNRIINNKQSIMHLLQRISEHQQTFGISNIPNSQNTQQRSINVNDFMKIGGDDDEEEEEEGEDDDDDDEVIVNVLNKNERFQKSKKKKKGKTSYLDESYRKYEKVVSTNYQYEVSESLLVRDCFYAMQGIDGEYIKYDHYLNGFSVDNKFGVPKYQRDSIRKICELGWLYKQISAFIEEITRNEFEKGLFLQSFCSSLKKELNDYFKFLVLVDTELSNSVNNLSIRKLLYLTREQLDKLKVLLILVDGCRNKNGGELLSCLYSYSIHGDPQVKKIICRVLNSIYLPFFNMIVKWVSDGQLYDPFKEFFIEENKVVEENFWECKYTIRKLMVPCFIHENMAKKILRIGKSINFIRDCCQQISFIMNRDIVAVIERTLNDKNNEWTNTNRFEQVFDKATEFIDKELMRIIYEKFNFINHLCAFQKYFLFGASDFHQMLLKLIAKELEKPTLQIDRFTLPSLLLDTVKSTTANFENENVKKCLSISLPINPSDNQVGEKIGWDVFSLNYVLQAPLNNVFTKEIIFEYQKVFQFVWKIKRIEKLLNSSWKKVNTVVKQCQKRELFQVITLVHPSCVYRHDMKLFIHNILYFFLFEIIETNFQVMMSKIEKMKNFNELIAINKEFPVRIIKGGFLEQNMNNQVNMLFTKILNLIRTYVVTQNALISQIKEIINKYLLSGRNQMMDTSDESSQVTNTLDLSGLTKIMERLEKIKTEYYKNVRELVAIKPKLFTML